MLCLVPIGRGLLDGSLTVFAAAQRAAVLVAVIWLLERYVLPLVVALAFPDDAVVAHAHAMAGDVVSADVHGDEVTSGQ